MIPAEFIQSLDLPPDKAAELQAALRKEDFYRSILYKAGVFPRTIPAVMKMIDTTGIDESKEALYLERAKVEFADFIPQKGRKL